MSREAQLRMGDEDSAGDIEAVVERVLERRLEPMISRLTRATAGIGDGGGDRVEVSSYLTNSFSRKG